MTKKINIGVIGFVVMFIFSRLFIVKLPTESFSEQLVFAMALGGSNPVGISLATGLLAFFGAFIIRLKFFPNEKKLRQIYYIIILLTVFKWISDFVFTAVMTGKGSVQWFNVFLFFAGAIMVHQKYIEKHKD